MAGQWTERPMTAEERQYAALRDEFDRRVEASDALLRRALEALRFAQPLLVWSDNDLPPPDSYQEQYEELIALIADLKQHLGE